MTGLNIRPRQQPFPRVIPVLAGMISRLLLEWIDGHDVAYRINHSHSLGIGSSLYRRRPTIL